ncbi:hypothetical protein ABIB85_008219 [Bradyrhizobium sp. JR1.5]
MDPAVDASLREGRERVCPAQADGLDVRQSETCGFQIFDQAVSPGRAVLVGDVLALQVGSRLDRGIGLHREIDFVDRQRIACERLFAKFVKIIRETQAYIFEHAAESQGGFPPNGTEQAVYEKLVRDASLSESTAIALKPIDEAAAASTQDLADNFHALGVLPNIDVRSFLLAGLLMTAAVLPSHALVIKDDPGGVIVDFVKKYSDIRDRGEKIVDDGERDSPSSRKRLTSRARRRSEAGSSRRATDSTTRH